MSLRVLVVDDAALFRKVMSDLLTVIPDVEVVGSAPNGRIALQKVRELRPDLLTLDLEMPEMDGLATLDALKLEAKLPAVIVVSALTRAGGDLTMRALQKGAFDFITKPSGQDAELSRRLLVADLTPRIRALAHRHAVRAILAGNGPVTPAKPASMASALPAGSALPATVKPPAFVLIGVSTGGARRPRATAAGPAGHPRGAGLHRAAHAAALHPVAWRRASPGNVR